MFSRTPSPRPTRLAPAGALVIAVAMAAAWFAPQPLAAQGTISALEMTVEDIGSHVTFATIAPGGLVQIRPGQTIRLRMIAIQAGGGRRYPSTKFTPDATNHISVDKVSEEVGNITLTGRRVHQGSGAVAVQYEILEDWRMHDELRKGRVYVQVLEAANVPTPQPQPGAASRGVELYENDDYRGKRQFFSASDPDLSDDGIGNDSVSSLKVSQGCTVTLYEDAGYRGRSVRVDSDTPSTDRIGFGNDAVSSLQIECR